MAFGHGKNGVFQITDAGGTLRNISAGVTSVAFSNDADTVDVSALGTNAKAYLAGMTDGTIQIAGFIDPVALTGTHTVLPGIVGNATLKAFSVGPQGSTTGLPRITGNCICTKYAPSFDTGSAGSFTSEFQISGVLVYDVFP